MILILDDNALRLDAFRAAAAQLGEGWKARTARSAPAWIEEAAASLADTRLISLDHDLDPAEAGVADPGTGRQAAEWLAARKPVCPVFVHTSNTDAAWGMYNVLSRAKWPVQIVHHVNDPYWIGANWLPAARRAVAVYAPVCNGRSELQDWLLRALSRRPADRYQSLERELRTWPQEFAARALFRIAIGANGTYAHFRAADFLLETEPALGLSCEQALLAIAAAPLDPDSQSLVVYMVTQYGRPEIERTIKRLIEEHRWHERLPQGLDAFCYFSRMPTARLRRGWNTDWRSWFPDAPEVQSWHEFAADLKAHILPLYLEHERSFDAPGIHGRMHVCRCLLFGEFMCRYYLQHALLRPALNDVRYAIAFHDAGRRENGPDLWGHASAALCAADARRNAGRFSRSPEEMAALVADKGSPGAAVEARIVHDADVLDIMRPCCGHGGREGFWEEKLFFLGPRDAVSDAVTRSQLIEEAWALIRATEQRKSDLRDSADYLAAVIAILSAHRKDWPMLATALLE